MFLKRRKKVRNTLPESIPMLEQFAGTHNDSELFKLFAAHQGRYFTKWVHYIEAYETHLAKFRNRPVNLLEIGIHKGGSLQLWKQYFAPGSRIFGADIDTACKAFEEENIQIFIGDQAERTFLREMRNAMPTLDIIIDDGGHKSIQQINSFEELYPKMSETGVYIVEDTHTNYWPKYQRGAPMSFIEYAKKLADSLHAWHFDQSNFGRFSQPHSKRNTPLIAPKVTEFTRTTQSITFYDSMVVFQKKPITEPYHCYVGKE